MSVILVINEMLYEIDEYFMEELIYLRQVSALHRLGFCELLLAKQLVPQDKITRTFELIIKEPIQDLVAEGEVG